MSSATPAGDVVWRHERTAWGAADLAAVLVWTLAVVAFFWDAATLSKALFYFDITEINYPYRDFFARELRAGRFSRWCPGLYCGLPLYSESQAGYLHPLKYLLYPWMATWKAFNLDTILSVWLTGLGTFGWLRRHVGAAAALTGAAVFGFGGFVWAHLIHTSMNNALTSVPFVFWALELAWERGRGWPLALGALALACQVFAGHLQDTILTAGAVGLFTLHRAATERGRGPRRAAIATAAGMVALGGMLAAVQWIPSKELLDRSPRAGGLSWDDLTYGSWHPELLPTLIVREAYGTRARDTDWMDGFYPYHEMNAYLGAIALALAVLGAAAYRDRWVSFWVILVAVGGVLMLGRFTLLFDFAHRIPVFGSSRIPVRYHLWVSLGIAALAAVGVDRLARPGLIRLRSALSTVGVLVLASLPILAWVYAPVWTEPTRWATPYHLARYRWLGNELAVATARTALLVGVAWSVAAAAARSSRASTRRRLAAAFPLLVIADLLGAHRDDVPTIDPAYWTVPPASARRLKADPTFVRVFGIAGFSAGEPGFASEAVDFYSVRDALDWSLPPVWGLASARGETPIIPRRMLHYTDVVKTGAGRFDIEGVTHLVSGVPPLVDKHDPRRAGRASILRNPNAMPRARLVGRPVYVRDEAAATQALRWLGASIRDRVVVEAPSRPLPVTALASGTARIVVDLPEHVVVETESRSAAYLMLADTYDPGWSATRDGVAAPIYPADVAFRAVYLPPGRHTVAFRYQPAGFATGLAVSGVGLATAVGLLLWPRRGAVLRPEHDTLHWPAGWPLWGLATLAGIVLASAVTVDPTGRVLPHPRWRDSLHRFTWGAGIEAMRRHRAIAETWLPPAAPDPVPETDLPPRRDPD